MCNKGVGRRDIGQLRRKKPLETVKPGIFLIFFIRKCIKQCVFLNSSSRGLEVLELGYIYSNLTRLSLALRTNCFGLFADSRVLGFGSGVCAEAIVGPQVALNCQPCCENI